MALPTITSGGKDRVPDAVKVLSKAFEEDPGVVYMLNNLSAEKRLAYIPSYFDVLFKLAGRNHATFEEIDDWSCCALFVPPGYSVDDLFTLPPWGIVGMVNTLGVRGMMKMLSELHAQKSAAMTKALKKGDKFYYLFFIGTRKDCRGKGLASALVKHYQAIAAGDGLPIWLESSTEGSHNLYTRLGFETVHEMVLGKGRAAADGTECEGGEGVKLWGMIWRPSL